MKKDQYNEKFPIFTKRKQAEKYIADRLSKSIPKPDFKTTFTKEQRLKREKNAHKNIKKGVVWEIWQTAFDMATLDFEKSKIKKHLTKTLKLNVSTVEKELNKFFLGRVVDGSWQEALLLGKEWKPPLYKTIKGKYLTDDLKIKSFVRYKRIGRKKE